MKYRTMDPMPNGPLADLEKIGDILMRRTSDKGKFYSKKQILKNASKYQTKIF